MERPDGRHRRLGKLPAQPARPHLRLSAVLRERLANPPARADWQSDAIAWPMYGNDRAGDCTCAGVGHMVNQLTFYGSGTEKLPAEKSVIGMYSAITGYDPSKTDPATGENPTDTGAYCQDVLSYWRKTGLEGHRITAYAALDVSNLNEIKQAISLFGTVYVGLSFPDSAMDQFNQGKPWDVVRGARVEGGHCVIVGAYGAAKFGLITWGAETTMSEAFWRAYVDEAWVVLDQDGLKKAGVYFTGAPSFYALGQAFAELTGEANPIPAPLPSPTPAPGPGQDPRLVQAYDLMQAWAHDHHVATTNGA
ncbi:hypothetical protein [Streptomyces sp. NPDC020298]|uniref:hypothetical protein n=1 Tax=unclassified Streptomyces TaxID=2593676 RepID=UPI0033E9B9DF